MTATSVPAIHFGEGTATLLPLMKEAGGDVIGLDWRTPLDWGWDQVGPGVAVQGNSILLRSWRNTPNLNGRCG